MAKKIYKNPKRTPEQQKRLAKRLVQYFFDNPHDNSIKHMSIKFKTDETFVRKCIEADLERRFKNAERVRNL